MPIENVGKVNVYVLQDLRTGAARYVGQTQQSVRDRLYRHVAAANYGRSSKVSSWVRELLAEGVRPEAVLLAQVALVDGDEEERLWIEDYLLDGADLLNETVGGRGSSGYKHSEESLIKVREARAQQVFDPEVNEKRAAALRGIPRPPEVRAKIAAGHLGKKRAPFSAEWKQKISESMKRARAERPWSIKKVEE